MSNPNKELLSQEQILQSVYNKLSDRLRVEFEENNSDNEVTSVFNEVKDLSASSDPIALGNITVTKGGYLRRVYVSGSNIGEYHLLVNGIVRDKKRTLFGTGLNQTFEFEPNETILNPGDVVTVQVRHSRPFPGDFNTRIVIINN